MNSRSKQAWALVAFIALCLMVGISAGLATSRSVQSWYPSLAKPAWTPPPWVFGPVWTVLYIMMGLAAWRVWRRAGSGPALAAFAVQLALNAAWSFCFFAWRSPIAGLVDIVLLWLAIVWTATRFKPLDRAAAWLLSPYLLWVTFAAGLNFSIWQLNG